MLASSLEVGVSERGVEVRLALAGRLARLLRGASDVRPVGGVSSRLTVSDLTGVQAPPVPAPAPLAK